jgi:hypothetical protein
MQLCDRGCWHSGSAADRFPFCKAEDIALSREKRPPHPAAYLKGANTVVAVESEAVGRIDCMVFSFIYFVVRGLLGALSFAAGAAWT